MLEQILRAMTLGVGLELVNVNTEFVMSLVKLVSELVSKFS